jgi:hypothetical protein
MNFLEVEKEETFFKELYENLVFQSFEPNHFSCKDLVIMIIAMSENTTIEKFNLAFSIFGENKIIINELVRITEVI